MHEESKEEFLARHRKSIGKELPVFEKECRERAPERPFKTLKKWLYWALLLAFTWVIYEIFGMMNSN